MSSTITLAGAAYVLGEEPCDYECIPDLAALCAERRVPFMPPLFGLRTYFRTNNVYSLAAESIRATLREAQLAASTVDCVIISSSSFRDGFATHNPGFGTILEQASLRPRTFHAVTGSGCAAMLAAIELGRDLVLCGTAGCALIVNIDQAPSLDERSRFIDYALVSDSAASVLVTQAREGYAAHRLLGICRRVQASQMVAGLGWTDYELSAAVLNDVLRTTGVQRADIGRLFSSNLFLPVARTRQRTLGFTAEQQYLDNIPRVGHCLAADPVINWIDCDRGEASPNPYLLFAEANGHAAAALIAA